MRLEILPQSSLESERDCPEPSYAPSSPCKNESDCQSSQYWTHSSVLFCWSLSNRDLSRELRFAERPEGFRVVSKPLEVLRKFLESVCPPDLPRHVCLARQFGDFVDRLRCDSSLNE